MAVLEAADDLLVTFPDTGDLGSDVSPRVTDALVDRYLAGAGLA